MDAFEFCTGKSFDNDGSVIGTDYKLLKPKFTLDVINYESLHKIEGSFDLVVLDEAHSLGAFPKPSKRAKQVKIIIQKSTFLLNL